MTVQSMLRLPHFITRKETSGSIVLLRIRGFHQRRRYISHEELLYASQITFITSYLRHFSDIQS